MMLIDRTDGLRTSLGAGHGSAEAVIRRNHPILGVAMPALGEAVCKAHEKGEASESLFVELSRIMDNSFIVPKYISDPESVFGLAKALCSKKKDDRERISPMDGLILSFGRI